MSNRNRGKRRGIGQKALREAKLEVLREVLLKLFIESIQSIQ